MAHLRKIRKRVTTHVILSDRNGDEMEYVTKEMLVPFDPPVCGSCHQEMKNVNTIEGKRRYSCMTWGCTNRRLYDEEGNRLGKDSGHKE